MTAFDRLLTVSMRADKVSRTNCHSKSGRHTSRYQAFSIFGPVAQTIMVDLAVFGVVETESFSPESFSPAEDQNVDEKIVGRKRSAFHCRAHGNQDC